MKMNNFFLKRIAYISVIIFSFLLYGIFFIENSRSCLGSPKILPTIFIAIPLGLFILIIDLIITFLSKNKENRKYIFLSFAYFIFIPDYALEKINFITY